MELKYLITYTLNLRSQVLIVPLWNWNSVQILQVILEFRFNRTFMELKWLQGPLSMLRRDSFNRTFMELKCSNLMRLARRLTVLIVPLWNWNNNLALRYNLDEACFNRTFMELKYYSKGWQGLGNIVLIVPLWNWNAWCNCNFWWLWLF